MHESVEWDAKTRLALWEKTMSNSRYYIVGNNQVWMTQFKEIENCQYESNDGAISVAIAVAQKLGMRVERAHVCVLDDDGRLRCKWSYNQDCHLRKRTSTGAAFAISLSRTGTSEGIA